MRLTLRTLLAYLDNTLSPQDSGTIREKLGESGFATNLVRRIRASLGRNDISAAPPDSVAPVGDPNAISEYLDNTLPNEQVAEIERAALENDAYLAEAAACHQILTMVLGKPAAVEPVLRNRIYELGSGSDPTAIVNPADAIPSGDAFGTVDNTPASSFSSLQMPDARDASDAEALSSGSRVIEPVGRDDSGVSNAAFRIPSDEQLRSAAAPIRSLPDEGFSFRPSRVVPWLVSLGLCAVLLYALAQVFAPLLSRDVADRDGPLPPTPSAPVEVGASLETGESFEVIPSPGDVLVEPDLAEATVDPLPPPSPTVSQDGSPKTAIGESIPLDGLPASDPTDSREPMARSDTGEELPAAADREAAVMEVTPTQATIAMEAGEPEAGALEAGSPEVDPTATAASVDKSAISNDSKPIGQADTPEQPESIATTVPASGSESDPDSEPGSAPEQVAAPEAAMAKVGPGESGVGSEPIMKSDVEPAAANSSSTEPAAAVGESIATLQAEPTLLLSAETAGWSRIAASAPLPMDTPLVAAPSFRPTVTIRDGLTLTVVGPAEFRLVQSDGVTVIQLGVGRVVIESTADNVDVALVAGSRLLGLNFETSGSAVAASVAFRRAPGAALDQPNRAEIVGLVCTKGKVDWAGEGEPMSLAALQGWSAAGDGEPRRVKLETLPAWTLPPRSRADSLEKTAREGLLTLLENDKPLAISLREATLFRRSEVAALAAQTLLAIGNAEVFFGGDGLLSRDKQKSYWESHFEALVSTANRSPQVADQILNDARRMDQANVETIAKLLTGYSNDMLASGGAEELIDWLQSPMMSNRVLAFLNLKAITGKTMLYRPEYDTTARREPAVKKWQARYRRGELRWADAPSLAAPATATKRADEPKEPGESAAAENVEPTQP